MINIPKQLRWEYRKLNRERLSALKGAFCSDIMYFRMPKVASQTITQALNEMENTNATVIPHSLSPAMVRRILQFGEKSFRFTFVRNPYTRFVSAYKWATRNNIDPLGYEVDVQQHSIISRYSSIDSFAVALPSIYQEHRKHLLHFIPQTEWVTYKGQLLIDFWGKLETLSESLTLLSAEGFNLPIVFGANTKNSAPSMAVEYNDEYAHRYGLSDDARHAISTFYENDFSVFNYKK